MDFNIYKPTSISIPENLPFKRDIKQDFDSFTKQPLSEEEKSLYDYKTLFYDIFFGVDNAAIYGVGPPLMNLYKEIPFSIFYKGKKVDYRIHEFSGCSILQLNQTFLEEEVKLLFDFAHFQKTILVPKFERQYTDLAVVACQKNNRPKWLHTWCKWYSKLYNAQIFLYDNGSDDFQKIVTVVKEFNPTVIKWDFTFGPRYTFGNRFCQIGAYNHFRLRHNFKYGLVFDIDEYLISKYGLKEYLDSHEELSVFFLDNYYIPNVRVEKEDFGIEDYYLRPKELKGNDWKYIFKREEVIYNMIHTVILKKGLPSSFPAKFGKHAKDLYFNHYKGLSTQWKPIFQRELIDPLTNDLVYDTEARKRIEQLNS